MEIINEKNIKPLRKKQFSLEDLEADDKYFRPKFLKEELLRPVVIDKPKQIDFDDNYISRKILQLTEKEVDFVGISNKAEFSAYDENVLEWEHFFSKALKFFFRTMPTEGKDVNFILP